MICSSGGVPVVLTVGVSVVGASVTVAFVIGAGAAIVFWW